MADHPIPGHEWPCEHADGGAERCGEGAAHSCPVAASPVTVTLTSTDVFAVNDRDEPVGRVWRGRSAGGLEVSAIVARVGVDRTLPEEALAELAGLREGPSVVAVLPDYQPPTFTTGPVDVFSDVRAFHTAGDVYEREAPGFPPQPVLALRLSLIREEVAETMEAAEAGDFPEFVDGCIDAIYVLAGALLACGVRPEAVWRAVQAANMAKMDVDNGGPHRREDGKIIKPAGWTPPDVAGALRAQGWPSNGSALTTTYHDEDTTNA